jgi:iron complex transport system ATP-binding protein
MLAARSVDIGVAGRTLVSGLAIEFAAGDCWAVLGRNGSGKSSLLLALAGLRPPAAGRVELQGRPIDAWSRLELAQRLAILLQDEPGDYWGSTLDYVQLGRYPRSRAALGGDAALASEALALLEEFDLGSHAGQPFRTLSGGERQRARLAQTLMQDTACLLLDEPLQHLDLKHQLTVMQALVRRAAGGRAVVMALHEPAMAARHCERAILLYDSGRVRHGRVDEMLTLDNLEALYQCRLEPATGAESRIFLPR